MDWSIKKWIVCILCSSWAYGIKMPIVDPVEEIFKWKTLAYDETPRSEKDTIAGYPYYSRENMNPTSVVFHAKTGMLLLAIPRVAPGVVSSLNVIDFHERFYLVGPRLKPFPNFEMNELKDHFFNDNSPSDQPEYQDGDDCVYRKGEKPWRKGPGFCDEPNEIAQKPVFTALENDVEVHGRNKIEESPVLVLNVQEEVVNLPDEINVASPFPNQNPIDLASDSAGITLMQMQNNGYVVLKQIKDEFFAGHANAEVQRTKDAAKTVEEINLETKTADGIAISNADNQKIVKNAVSVPDRILKTQPQIETVPSKMAFTNGSSVNISTSKVVEFNNSSIAQVISEKNIPNTDDLLNQTVDNVNLKELNNNPEISADEIPSETETTKYFNEKNLKIESKSYFDKIDNQSKIESASNNNNFINEHKNETNNIMVKIENPFINAHTISNTEDLQHNPSKMSSIISSTDDLKNAIIVSGDKTENQPIKIEAPQTFVVKDLKNDSTDFDIKTEDPSKFQTGSSLKSNINDRKDTSNNSEIKTDTPSHIKQIISKPSNDLQNPLKNIIEKLESNPQIETGSSKISFTNGLLTTIKTTKDTPPVKMIPDQIHVQVIPETTKANETLKIKGRKPKVTASNIHYTIHESHKEGPTIVSVHNLFIDRCDRLWFVDSGVLEYKNDVIVVQAPSLWVVDISKKGHFLILRRHVFSDKIKHGAGLKGLTVDVEDSCNYSKGYIANQIDNTLVVYDFETGKDWQFYDESFAPDLQSGPLFDYEGVSMQIKAGITSLALGWNDNSGYPYLYYMPFSSTKQFVVSIKYVGDLRNAPSSYPQDAFMQIGDRGPHSESSSFVFDKRTGVFFFTEVETNSIRCWNARKTLKPSNIGTVISDKNLNYPAHISIDLQGNLWVLSNKYPEFILSGLKHEDYNVRLYRIDTQNAIKDSICDSPGTPKESLYDKLRFIEKIYPKHRRSNFIGFMFRN